MSKSTAGGDALYSDYADWKKWGGEFEPSERESRYFSVELADVEIAGRRVLEIGFGNGSFLEWARRQGALVVGTELDAAMVERARSKGFEAHTESLHALVASGQRFDLVVAFDVFEHWDTPALITNLQQIALLLNPAGQVLARFPNGQSPFGRVFQYGDLTHRGVLSASSVRQLARMTGYTVERVGNAQRVPVHSDFFSRVKHHWRRAQCARIERRLARLYGFGRLALDPNLTALLRKNDALPAGPAAPSDDPGMFPR